MLCDSILITVYDIQELCPSSNHHSLACDGFGGLNYTARRLDLNLWP